MIRRLDKNTEISNEETPLPDFGTDLRFLLFPVHPTNGKSCNTACAEPALTRFRRKRQRPTHHFLVRSDGPERDHRVQLAGQYILHVLRHHRQQFNHGAYARYCERIGQWNLLLASAVR